MSDFIAWRFLIFAIVFAGLLYLQFFLARRQWKKIKGTQAAEIDVGYVRMEDYLAQSFRRKVKEWLKLPPTSVTDGARTILKGRETIRVTTNADFDAGEHCNDILVIDGDFNCGPNCVFSREILVKGSARIGPGTQLQSIAVEGNLTLESDVRVARWMDSSRELTIGTECLIGARVTSQGAIRLGSGAQAESFYAPQVATLGWDGTFAPNFVRETAKLPEIVFTEDMAATEERLYEAGFDVKRLIQLAPDCWLYKGDFRNSTAFRLKSKLVVKGKCEFPDGCILDADVRADGALSIGANSVCRANLTSGGDLSLGPGCRFAGVLHADGSIHLGRGTRGFKDDGLVVAFAGDSLRVERDVAVKGKLAAGGRVIVESAEAMEAKQHGA